jgi:hypothetical protein
VLVIISLHVRNEKYTMLELQVRMRMTTTGQEQLMSPAHHTSLTSVFNHMFWDWHFLVTRNTSSASVHEHVFSYYAGNFEMVSYTIIHLNKCASSHCLLYRKRLIHHSPSEHTSECTLTFLTNSAFRDMARFECILYSSYAADNACHKSPTTHKSIWQSCTCFCH